MILLLLASALVLILAACGGSKAPVPERIQAQADPTQMLYTHDAPQNVRVMATVVYSDGSTVDVSGKVKKQAELITVGETLVKLTCTLDGVILSGKTTVIVHESPFVWQTVPEEYQADCAEKGTIEHVTYDSFVYTDAGERGSAGTNEAYVYLPYGYDETEQYNILYLMHGGGENAGYWFSQGNYADGGWSPSEAENITATILDNAIARGMIEPLIVVTPCIYTGDVENRAENSTGLNGVAAFRYEFRNELVPCIESRYASYALGDVSEENLIATRAHRGYAGLSMGSMTGFSSILMGCTDLVAYVGNYSGCWADIEAVEQALTETYDDYPILYWYNGEGTKDMAHDEHCEAYARIIADCPEIFTEGVDFSRCNAIMVDKLGHAHNYANWIVDLYNTLVCFFC